MYMGASWAVQAARLAGVVVATAALVGGCGFADHPRAGDARLDPNAETPRTKSLSEIPTPSVTLNIPRPDLKGVAGGDEGDLSPPPTQAPPTTIRRVPDGVWCNAMSRFIFESEQVIIAPDFASARSRLENATGAFDEFVEFAPDELIGPATEVRGYLGNIRDVADRTKNKLAVTSAMEQAMVEHGTVIARFLDGTFRSCPSAEGAVVMRNPPLDMFRRIIGT
jgi:hypothetical protein